jgi:hypothetical protein
MQIEHLTQTQSTTTARIGATIIWEDSQRPGRTIFFETPDMPRGPAIMRFSAAVIPAMQHGERRVNRCADRPDLIIGH